MLVWLNLAKAAFLLIFYPLAEANSNDGTIHCRPQFMGRDRGR